MKKIIVYSTDYCPYCDKAKQLLQSLKLDFEEVNISNDPEEKIALLQKTGHKTVPQIFIDDQFIGGYMELYDLYKSDKLTVLAT